MTVYYCLLILILFFSALSFMDALCPNIETSLLLTKDNNDEPVIRFNKNTFGFKKTEHLKAKSREV